MSDSGGRRRAAQLSRARLHGCDRVACPAAASWCRRRGGGTRPASAPSRQEAGVPGMEATAIPCPRRARSRGRAGSLHGGRAADRAGGAGGCRRRRSRRRFACQYALARCRRLPAVRPDLRGHDRRADASRCSRGDTLKIKLINDLPPNRDAGAGLHGPAAPAQHDQLPFPRLAMSARAGSRTTCCARWTPGKQLRHRDQLPDDHTGGHLLVPPAPPRRRRHPDRERHGRRDRSSRATSTTCRRSRRPRSASWSLSEVVFDAYGMVEDFDTLFPETARRFLTVNGQREPTIDMRPGEVQRWRMLHAGYQDDIYLALDGHSWCRSPATASRSARSTRRACR